MAGCSCYLLSQRITQQRDGPCNRLLTGIRMGSIQIVYRRTASHIRLRHWQACWRLIHVWLVTLLLLLLSNLGFVTVNLILLWCVDCDNIRQRYLGALLATWVPILHDAHLHDAIRGHSPASYTFCAVQCAFFLEHSHRVSAHPTSMYSSCTKLVVKMGRMVVKNAAQTSQPSCIP